MKEKITAIILAAGSGRRMNSAVPKQYLLLDGRPVLYYTLRAFEESAVTDIVLVIGADEMEYCRQEFMEKYRLSKITAVVAGGRERYHSVYEGLKAAAGSDYVLIHDGARPFVTADVIARSIEAVKVSGACAAGMPVKDTIKVVDADGLVKETPVRSTLWQIQTPQSFSCPLITRAYKEMIASGRESSVTDDAMVLERMTGQRVRVIEGDYRNIKITTPEDLLVAEAYLKDVEKK